ncbi:helix-turn-helix transcriptional regulator [Nocardioides sp. BP30]|uniref:helix-turn-helix transcriptional regulator n=1 Tax=Nocardioides sp. BP30 TaxID=3036374 RepID=UPI0024697024|nr:helix-turn-helix transcriptional regulator [Nocardioides sp. BP30]WGL53379.1 helix-turn-helix transcriptional regulator [Nocardioides sp. BP30]
MVTELGEFLRSRRAAISPEQAGLVSYGARRVPGLRREELAQLAGVSPTYYTRLEQSDQHQASDAVLDALARALRLSDGEREHLHRLARPAGRVSTPRCARPRPSALMVMHTMPSPALILDHTNDVVAWNRLGHLLLGHTVPYELPATEERPNLARMLFLEPGGTALYADPDEAMRTMIGFLRYSSGLYPDDQRLSRLVGELAQRSDAFAQVWAEHPVADCGFGVKRFRHPLVGRLELTYEVMRLPESSLRMVVYTAEPGSATHDGLELLARS